MYAPERRILYIWYSKVHLTFLILIKNIKKKSKLSRENK